MRRFKLHLALVVVTALLVSTLSVGCSTTPSYQLSPTEQPARQAQFTVGSVAFAPTAVMAGDTVTIATSLANTGGMTGTYTAILYVNGQEVDKKAITIEPGSSQGVSFQLLRTNPGIYYLSIGNSSTTLPVNEWRPYKIQYDESLPVAVGAFSAEGLYVAGEDGHIVRFTPPVRPFRIQRISVFGAANPWDIYELDEKHVTARIWGKGASSQLWSQDFPWRLFEGFSSWRYMEVPDIRVDDDFYVELVTHSEPTAVKNGLPSPGGDPVGAVSCGIKQACSPWSVIVIAFDYPQSYISSSNRIETRSGYSYMGKPFSPTEARFEGIRWFIRVEGEGPPSN